MQQIVLQIPWEIWQKMRTFVELANPSEITGFGTIHRITPSILQVDEIFIPQQFASTAHCETLDGAVNEIISDVIEHDPNRASDLRFRWHSHADSNVFWSQTDEQDIAHWQAPWAVNLVMNAFGEYLARLDLFEDFRITNIPLFVQFTAPVTHQLRRECDKEIHEKVTFFADNGTPITKKEVDFIAF